MNRLLKILVVDDDENQRLLMRNVFMMRGWTVFLAEQGKEALEKMKREHMDIIVSDIYMPVMDGIVLHKTVRSMPGCETIPFLFVSGYDDSYTVGAVKDPTIDGFFQKGRDIAELHEWVEYLTTPKEKRSGFRPGGKPAGRPR